MNRHNAVWRPGYLLLEALQERRIDVGTSQCGAILLTTNQLFQNTLVERRLLLPHRLEHVVLVIESLVVRLPFLIAVGLEFPNTIFKVQDSVPVLVLTSPNQEHSLKKTCSSRSLVAPTHRS